MTSRRSILFSMVLAVGATFGGATAGAQDQGPKTYAGYSLVDITTTSPKDVATLERAHDAIPMACCVHHGTDQWLIPADQINAVRASGMMVRVVVDDVEPILAAERARVAAPAEGNWYADFKDWDAINIKVDEIVASRPDLVTKLTLGQSLQGRDIVGMRISGPGTDKPAVLFNAAQHAREWIAPMVPMYIAEQLIAEYDTNPVVQELVDGVEIFIVPVVNPDGYEYSWDVERFWRKNRRNNGNGTWGVDLNRNWDIDWNGGDSNSNDGNSDVYVGTAPMSEPEVQVMAAFIASHPNLVAHIDFHSHGNMILHPWGWTLAPSPDDDIVEPLGEAMQAAIASVHGVSYASGQPGEVLYLADGIFPDWTYDAHGMFGYTIELRGPGFDPPPSTILPTCEENFVGVQTMMQFVLDQPGVNFTFPQGLPDYINSDTPTSTTVEITPVFAGPVMPGTPSLHARVAGESNYTAYGLTNLGNDTYGVTFPTIPCNETLEYYFDTDTQDGGTYASPEDAPATIYTADSVEINTIVDLDFNADPAWAISGDASDGQWEQGVPAGDGDRSDPTTDGDGSGGCYLTDNVAGNSDVDGGSTILTSPAFDMTGGGVISYLYWLNDETNTMGPEDFFRVEIATNAGGTNWAQYREYTSGASVWRGDAIELSDAVATDTVRVRFTVADLGAGDVIEAGLDAFSIEQIDCQATPCVGDVDGGDDIVNVSDLLAMLAAWGTNDPVFDIVPDGNVDIQDLLLLLSVWGPCE